MADNPRGDVDSDTEAFWAELQKEFDSRSVDSAWLDPPRDAEVDIDTELRLNVEKALRLIDDRQAGVTVAGPAGCGKSKGIEYISKQYPGTARVVAYMGQAARMLQRRGIKTSTIHRLIYYPLAEKRDEISRLTEEIKRREAKGEPTVILRQSLDKLLQPGFVFKDDLGEVDLIIVDEASMVNGRLAEDLESFDIPILAIGDPYQLEPVEGKMHFPLGDADVKLEKIFRHEEGGAILDLANALRSGRAPKGQNSDEVRIRQYRSMDGPDIKKWLLWADRIVCATNNTRRRINRRILGYLDLGPYPRGKGEKLICLHNYWKSELLNGQAIRLEEIEDDGDPLYFTAHVLRDEGDQWVRCGKRKIYKGHFNFTAERLTHRKATEQLQLDHRDINRLGLIEADWAYCTTVHKSQGSEWDRVLVITETWPTEKEERDRMLYTAVTRACKELRIIGYWGVR